MVDWLYSRRGQATIICDGDCFRDDRGRVVGWISGENVYSLRGRHIGWFEGGVLYDSNNRALGFLTNASDSLPTVRASEEPQEPPVLLAALGALVSVAHL